MRSLVVGTGSYAPEKVLTNRDLEKLVETSDDWIVERTGIRERHVAAATEATSDLALKASQKALKMAGIRPEDVDLIVVGTITPDMPFPSAAAVLQAHLHNVLNAQIGPDGRLLARAQLAPSRWHGIQLDWSTDARNCQVTLDGSRVGAIPLLRQTAGLCYLRLSPIAIDTDPAGFLVESVEVDVGSD